ncbi:MAG TPA: sigma 54-interacting transcriptional regulator, partial [Polyangia bacterium]|nr:sigma 54-interacting transcriptional regulator [Polyangia bacterium]
STPTDADDDTSRRFIAARVLTHPDPARVGEFAPLFDAGVEDTRSVVVNRLSPEFRTPAGDRSGPLESTRISRSPLEVTRHLDGLRLNYAFASPAVEVNGQPLVGQRVLSAEELQAGIIVLIGKDLVLWIGWLELIDPAPAVKGLVGESTVMRRLRQQIHRVADLEVPVLLRGATGVGKELVAAAIHKYSRRAAASYVAVNVAGVPPTMAASELFGHKRGAFTGATEERKGYFAQANGGTLFLDEIGDVSFDVQALLLRAVQEGVIQPLGGSTRQVDVRLIAATDSDLESAVARHEFREPLLRRFSYEIHVPALRTRRDDIGILFYHLLRERLESMGEGHRLESPASSVDPFVPGAYIAQMALYSWPGNVRELANVALKFAIENRGRARARIGDELRNILRPRNDRSPETTSTPPASRRAEEVSDADIIAALQAEGYRRERAAKRLGVSKSYLYKRLQGSPASRSVQDISTDEIRSALSDCGGDVGAAAERLRVSGRALRLQLKRIEPPSA